MNVQLCINGWCLDSLTLVVIQSFMLVIPLAFAFRLFEKLIPCGMTILIPKPHSFGKKRVEISEFFHHIMHIDMNARLSKPTHLSSHK